MVREEGVLVLVVRDIHLCVEDIVSVFVVVLLYLLWCIIGCLVLSMPMYRSMIVHGRIDCSRVCVLC